jgi:hypothetical protein
MAERPLIDFAAVVASIGRATPEEGSAPEAEAAVDTLCFLEARAEQLNADPGPAAHLAVLDLCAALLAFGGVRNVDELAQWLREEVPDRARELAKAVAASGGPLSEAPPCACLRLPPEAIWH